ncbi:MATE family efflux transporter [Salinadaptatus halalkaliphilus]|uniref:Multidrug-efflux transporter n=1 Tax=Salinadaptatus halalkaliphilus TaxID=2419781 RepID=A0A4S3TH46_9EURY|nr:MATE family efflux transporter [Salinadaptatus halalkaliphilus]THE63216.1 MATE family efflux transporter [Salinadaptatus halalkaliphilus]
MFRRLPNPLRLSILWIGLALSKLGLVDARRVRRATDLAWPRIVTGLARMSKNAVDVAMVGIAAGSAAIAGVGLAMPFWGLGRAVGGGVAGGTIALVSQRYGADAYAELGDAIRSSFVLALGLSIPFTVAFFLVPEELISLLTSDAESIRLGAVYLQTVSLGIPFACLNLVGSRLYVGMDDSWTPMVIRAGGATVNIVLNAVFIFGLDLGVFGAALGTTVASIAVTVAFAVGLIAGRLPGIGTFPIQVDPFGSYLTAQTHRELFSIGTPVLAKMVVWRLSEFPILAIVARFGPEIVAAYVIARRIFDLMNTPGWGFSLACSSLVGQELGTGNEQRAEIYAREIVLFAVVVYGVLGAAVFVFAEPITLLFVDDPSELSVSTAVAFVYSACGAVVFKGVARVTDGALNGAGDTQWPFYSQAIGMFGVAIPVAYIGATTSLGVIGLYLIFFAESVIPAAINYRRFDGGEWKVISRGYRPPASKADD